MQLSDYILISRNGTTYKAKLSTLSSVILLHGMKDSFMSYLNDLSSSIESLTTTFDVLLYPKSEMKSDFTIIDNVSNLSGGGTFVTVGDAKTTADSVKSTADLDNWYKTQSTRAVENILAGYTHAIGILKDDTDPAKATEYGITPSYDKIMETYGDKDL